MERGMMIDMDGLKYYKTEKNIWGNVSGLLDMMKITNQLLYCPNILVMTSMT